MENKICVYAICKNEEKFVDKWINSMKEADSIVVLDTGSTDNTFNLLKKYSESYPFIQVYQKIIDPWRFDVARNESLKFVPDDCNILFCTDLDELLDPGWSIPLRNNWIEGKHQRASYYYAWSHNESGEPARVFYYNKIHSRNWEWIHPVHEILYNKETNSTSYTSNEVLNLFNDVHLHHYPDKFKSRSSYLPLLRIRVEESPNDLYSHLYFAHELYYQGLFEESIDELNHILIKFSNELTSIEKASCYLFLGDSYRSLHSIRKDSEYKTKAIKSYTEAINVDKTYREPYLNLSKIYIDLKLYDFAIDVINTGIKTSYRHFSWLERDASWTSEPWDLLSIAYFYSGRKRVSIIYAAKAESCDPSNERLKNNVKVILNSLTDSELL